VLVSEDIPERELDRRVAERDRRRRVQILAPQRGGKRDFVAMAEANAAIALQNHLLSRGNRQQLVQEELTRALSLPGQPKPHRGLRHLQHPGHRAGGSMVVWENGGMKKDDYKRFKIRTVSGADDFGSLREVLGRRFGRALEQGSVLPDLVLIDGGARAAQRGPSGASGARAGTTSRWPPWQNQQEEVYVRR